MDSARDSGAVRAAAGDPARAGPSPTFRLPALIRRHEHWIGYAIPWAPYIAIYQVTNRWPVREPIELPFTWVDRMIPFVPELLPVYVAYIPLYWWTVARSENDREANRIFYATHFQLLLTVPFFVLMPVRMPRELFYPPEVYGWADAFWRWFDEPNNCFPSLHVSNCLMLMRFNWHRRYRWPATLVAAGVVLSTVPVKQHYAVDLLGGGAVYLASVWFIRRLEVTGLTEEGRRRPPSRARSS